MARYVKIQSSVVLVELFLLLRLGLYQIFASYSLHGRIVEQIVICKQQIGEGIVAVRPNTNTGYLVQ